MKWRERLARNPRKIGDRDGSLKCAKWFGVNGRPIATFSLHDQKGIDICHIDREEIHYTNYHRRRLEQQHIDYSHPSSILYKRTAEGLEAIGVMYTTGGSTPSADRHGLLSD